MANQITRDPFPARTKSASGAVNGVHTNVTSVAFADKIVLSISQDGRLAHWVRWRLDTVPGLD
jgi:proteasome assembly chaperone 3